jgi:biotin synthase
MIGNILADARNGRALDSAQATELLSIPVNSEDYYTLLFVADAYARQTFKGKGMVFAQIGIDAQGCRINCKFCSLAKNVLGGRDVSTKSMDEVVARAKALASSGIQDLFLMTTAEFSQEQFLEYGRAVRAVLPRDMRLVANVGDFDFNYARSLKDAGFTGVYHIHRLREGVDTGASPEARVNTLNAVRDAGLELYIAWSPSAPNIRPRSSYRRCCVSASIRSA